MFVPVACGIIFNFFVCEEYTYIHTHNSLLLWSLVEGHLGFSHNIQVFMTICVSVLWDKYLRWHLLITLNFFLFPLILRIKKIIQNHSSLWTVQWVAFSTFIMPCNHRLPANPKYLPQSQETHPINQLLPLTASNCCVSPLVH